MLSINYRYIANTLFALPQTNWNAAERHRSAVNTVWISQSTVSMSPKTNNNVHKMHINNRLYLLTGEQPASISLLPAWECSHSSSLPANLPAQHSQGSQQHNPLHPAKPLALDC